MADERARGGNRKGMTVTRRQAIGRAAAVSAATVVATSVAAPAWATDAADPRLRTFEGCYAIDSHKVVDGYFARPRGRTGMDVLVVIPRGTDISDAERDLARRHALGGQIAFVPNLARTNGNAAISRDAMVADFLTHTPRFAKQTHANGTVRVVAA